MKTKKQKEFNNLKEAMDYLKNKKNKTILVNENYPDTSNKQKAIKDMTKEEYDKWLNHLDKLKVEKQNNINFVQGQEIQDAYNKGFSDGQNDMLDKVMYELEHWHDWVKDDNLKEHLEKLRGRK